MWRLHLRSLLRGVVAGSGSAAVVALGCPTSPVRALEQRDSESKPSRQAIGGVAHEILKPLRQVHTIEPALQGFFSKETSVRGIPLRAHSSVSDSAIYVAADRLGRMLRQFPEEVLTRLRRRGASFHVIAISQGTSDLPEHAHMKGVDGGYTGEKGLTLDMRARGMGGVNSSCGEENLIDLDADPRYGGSDILVHEFSHCIMDVGLSQTMRQAIVDTYKLSVEGHGRWTREDGARVYAGSCAEEYFAELTMWYFGSHGEFVDRCAKLPTPGPGGLAQYDPDGFSLLTSIYGGTHPGLKELDPKLQRLVRCDMLWAKIGA